jgi:hypothetical protein
MTSNKTSTVLAIITIRNVVTSVLLSTIQLINV